MKYHRIYFLNQKKVLLQETKPITLFLLLKFLKFDQAKHLSKLYLYYRDNSNQLNEEEAYQHP